MEVMIEPWWRRVATFDSCTAEDHRGAPSLRPIIVKMPKHDAATAKSWMLQQPMFFYVGGAATARRRLALFLSGAAARDGFFTLFCPPECFANFVGAGRPEAASRNQQRSAYKRRTPESYERLKSATSRAFGHNNRFAWDERGGRPDEPVLHTCLRVQEPSQHRSGDP